jgi:hypothetical protein
MLRAARFRDIIPGREKPRAIDGRAATERGLRPAEEDIFKKSAKEAWQVREIAA